MCPVDSRRPYTEMFEVAQKELVREAATDQEPKFKGLINQVYLNEMPSLLPERYIKTEGFILTKADKTDGNIAIAVGGTIVTGSSVTYTSANSDDFVLKVTGSDFLHRVTYTAGTELTFKNSLTWQGATVTTADTYALFQDRYAVATDFAYMAQDNPEDPNIVYRYSNGAKLYLKPIENEEFDRRFSGIVGDLYSYTVKWIDGSPYLYLQMGPDVAENIGYEYIPVLNNLVEYTVGTITLTTGTAVVSGLTTPVWTSLNSAETYYLRNDADGVGSESKWGKILSFANATALTLTSAWAYTSGEAISYTIASISRWPARFDDVMIYKAALIADPDNVQQKKWSSIYGEAVALDKTVESKRNQGGQLKGFPGLRRY